MKKRELMLWQYSLKYSWNYFVLIFWALEMLEKESNDELANISSISESSDSDSIHDIEFVETIRRQAIKETFWSKIIIRR